MEVQKDKPEEETQLEEENSADEAPADEEEKEVPSKNWTVDKLKSFLDANKVSYKANDSKAVLLQLAENVK